MTAGSRHCLVSIPLCFFVI